MATHDLEAKDAAVRRRAEETLAAMIADGLANEGPLIRRSSASNVRATATQVAAEETSASPREGAALPEHGFGCGH